MVLKVDGLKINFRVSGEGSDLILLHGWGCDANIWETIIPCLSSFSRVIALDLPGFGKSDFPKKTWTLSNYTQFLKKIIKELGLKKPTLLGHSFGGRIAIKCATSYPKLVKKLILVSTAGIRPKRNISWWFLFLTAKVGKLVCKIPPLTFFSQSLRRLFYQTIKRADYFETGRLKKTFLSIIEEDLTPILAKVSTPTLIIWGDKDKEVPLKLAQRLASKIPNSRLHLFRNCGHFPFLEKPKEFAQIVEEFIKKDA